MEAGMPDLVNRLRSQKGAQVSKQASKTAALASRAPTVGQTGDVDKDQGQVETMRGELSQSRSALESGAGIFETPAAREVDGETVQGFVQEMPGGTPMDVRSALYQADMEEQRLAKRVGDLETRKLQLETNDRRQGTALKELEHLATALVNSRTMPSDADEKSFIALAMRSSPGMTALEAGSMWTTVVNNTRLSLEALIRDSPSVDSLEEWAKLEDDMAALGVKDPALLDLLSLMLRDFKDDKATAARAAIHQKHYTEAAAIYRSIGDDKAAEIVLSAAESVAGKQEDKKRRTFIEDQVIDYYNNPKKFDVYDIYNNTTTQRSFVIGDKTYVMDSAENVAAMATAAAAEMGLGDRDSTDTDMLRSLSNRNPWLAPSRMTPVVTEALEGIRTLLQRQVSTDKIRQAVNDAKMSMSREDSETLVIAINSDDVLSRIHMADRDSSAERDLDMLRSKTMGVVMPSPNDPKDIPFLPIGNPPSANVIGAP
jgi:hypothetical protein